MRTALPLLLLHILSDGARAEHAEKHAAASFAVLPLHGSLSNQGYLYADVHIGTPPQPFSLIVDTGSTTTYIPCTACQSDCGANKMHDRYNPAGSGSYQGVACGSLLCATGICSTDVLTEERNSDASLGESACLYTRHYAEHSSSTGQLVSDILHVPLGIQTTTNTTTQPINNTSSLSRRVVFGCEIRETGYIYEQSADGVLGLGRSSDAVLSQLAIHTPGLADDTQHYLSRSFALCLGGLEGGGSLIVGAAPMPRVLRDAMRYAKLSFDPRHPSHYLVHLAAIQVADTTIDTKHTADGGGTVVGSLLDAARRVFSDEPWSFAKQLREEESMTFSGITHAIIDSGTTFMYFPSDLHQRIVQIFDTHVASHGGRRVMGPDPASADKCWGYDASAPPSTRIHNDGGEDGNSSSATSILSRMFPSVALLFPADSAGTPPVELRLSPEHVLFPHARVPGAFCLGVFDGGDGSHVVVGSAALRDVLVEFDAERARIGILQDQRLSCAKLPLLLNDYMQGMLRE